PPPPPESPAQPEEDPDVQQLQPRAFQPVQQDRKAAQPFNNVQPIEDRGRQGDFVAQDAVGQPQWVVPEQEADRLLRQKGDYQKLLQRHMGRRVQLPPAQDPSIV